MRNFFILSRLAIIPIALPIGANAENYRGWTPANKLARRAELCEIVAREIQDRAARLGKESGQPYVPVYQFPANEKEKAKMTVAWAAKKYKDDEVSSRWKDLLRINKELAAKEAEARPQWQEKMKDTLALQRAEKEGPVYGTRVKARKLGAILDNSPSMAKYLPALRREISRTFEDYPSIEVWGSFLNRFTTTSLHMNSVSADKASNLHPDRMFDNVAPETWVDARWFHAAPRDGDDPFDPAWHFPVDFPAVPTEYLHLYGVLAERDNVSAILGMVELHKVNALYWFCDLRDTADQSAVKRISDCILKNKVTFYIHTVGKKPQPDLLKLVTQSGGAVLTEKPKIIPADKPAK